MTTMLRLTNGNPKAWALWPMLETRVRAFCATETPDTPSDAVIQHLRRLFLESPDSLGAWVVLNEHGAMIGHLVGWVDLYWGCPYLLVHQAALDQGQILDPTKQAFMAALRQWGDTVNAQFEAAGRQERVARVRWMTTRPEAWIRYFGHQPQQQTTVLELSLKEATL